MRAKRLLCLLFAALFMAVVWPAVPVGGADFSADPFSYQVVLEGTVFALPCSASALADAGWQTDVPESEPFDAGTYAHLTYQKGEAVITATVANLGAQSASLAQCSLVGLAAQQGGGALELAGGIAPGTSRQQVVAVCGAPDRPTYTSGLGDGVAAPGTYAAEGVGWEGDAIAAGGTAVNETGTLRYTTGRHSYLQFTFDENDALYTLEVQALEAAPTLPDVGTLPAEVQTYTAPEALGGDWQSFGVDYAGALYTLPAPVSAFLQNGWVLRDEATLEPGQWLLGVRLQKGNQTLRTRVQNFSGEATGLAGCFVTLVSSSTLGTDLPLSLSGGVSSASTQDEVLALLGMPHGVYTTSTAVTYTYLSANGRVDCTFSPQDGSMLTLEASCTSLAGGEEAAEA